MKRIQQITSDAKQRQTLILDDGSSVIIQMRFAPLQYGWFFDEITHLDFCVKGLRITNNFNMLLQFRNIIPFGLGCISDENREPTQKEDFSSEASKLYILSEEEVDQFTDFLNGQSA